MSKRFRRILFWIIVGCFLVAGFVVLIYSFGYRLDSETLKFVKTGGLYLKTSPKVADVFLDGEKINKSSGLLTSGIFIQNLIPKNYQLKISKADYFEWQKKIKIEPTLVNSFSHIVLLPKSPFKEKIYLATSTEEIMNFLPLENSDELLSETREKNRLGWFDILKIVNKKEGTATEIFKRKIASAENLDLLNKLIFEDNKPSRLIIPFYDKVSAQTTFYLWDRLEPAKLANLSQVFSQYLAAKIKKIIFHPFEESKFFVETTKKIVIFDSDRGEISYLPANNPLDFVLSGGNLFWVEKDGSVYSYNLILKSISPLAIIEEKNLEIGRLVVSSNSEYTAVLLKGGKLFLIQGGQPPKILSEKAEAFVFSFDNKKVAYLENGRLKIYFLEDLIQDITKKAGEEVVIEDFGSETATNFSWYKDSFHLIIQTGEKTFFAEIDDRDKINTFDYQFGSGRYLFGKEGIVFRLAPSFIERINLVIGE